MRIIAINASHRGDKGLLVFTPTGCFAEPPGQEQSAISSHSLNVKSIVVSLVIGVKQLNHASSVFTMTKTMSESFSTRCLARTLSSLRRLFI